MQGNISDPSPPGQSSWSLPTLYKSNQLGKYIQWQISFNIESKELVRIWGQVGGNLQNAPLAIETNQSGKTLQEQAWLQAKREYIDKTREGYSITGTPTAETEAQLCNKWKPGTDLKRSSTGTVLSCMVKLDGLRAIFRRMMEGGMFKSRETLTFKFLQHLVLECTMFCAFLPPGYDPDGELWSHNMTHEEVSGLIRRTLEKPAGIEDVQYLVFDLCPPKGCKDDVLTRYSYLYRAYLSYLKYRQDSGLGESKIHLLRYFVAQNDAEVVWFHDECKKAGYEGVVMRHLTGKDVDYRGDRNNCWLKYKSVQDEEGLVIGVEACKGNQSHVAKLVVKDKRGNELRIKCKGELHHEAKTWLQNPHSIIGHLVTYEFQELTAKGVPRFPVGIRKRYDISIANWLKEIKPVKK